MSSSIQPAAQIAGRYTSQGMIGPQQFVQPSGDLTAVSFRFLNSLFQAVSLLQGQAAAAQANVEALTATVQTLQQDAAARRGAEEGGDH